MGKDVVLQSLGDYEVCREYVEDFYNDPALASFQFANLDQIKYNLKGAIEKGNGFAAVLDGQTVGVFGLLVLPEDRYIEMTVGISDHQRAYEKLIQYLEEGFPGYQADFVFNPKNFLLKDILSEKGAEFETEQMKMVFQGPVLEMDTRGIVPFASEYMEQYLAIHNTDMYWTGKKVLKAPEKFRTFLAVEEGKVVGYLDVTHCFEENEPYDFMVLEAYRRRGYGRKLLARALQENASKQMILMVDVDNSRSIPLYESMGFVKTEKENCLTAHWNIMDRM